LTYNVFGSQKLILIGLTKAPVIGII
jgi:hypothetical protein